MDSVNLGMMKDLLQVTPLSKTFESASSFESSNSDISFATILNDINQNGIELNDNEATMYEQILTDNDVDLNELHKILSDANFNLDQMVENEESTNLIDMLIAINESLPTEVEVKEVETNEDESNESVVLMPEPVETAKPTETEIKVEPKPEVVKEETTTLVDETLVYEEIAGPIQEAKVPVEPEAVTIEPKKHTYKPNETEKPKKENNEQINIDEAIFNSDSLLMQVDEVPVDLEKDEQVDSKVEISVNEAKPVYEFASNNDNEVIISDDSVLKLDLMFKDVFKETEETSNDKPEFINVNHMPNNMNNDDMKMEVIEKEESTSDSELAYRQMNSFRVNLDELNNNQQIITQSYTEKAVFTAEDSLVNEAKEINLTSQIQNSFASKVDLNDEFVIKLKPEGIGEIVVKMVSGSDGNTSVSMITNNQHVKALLESDMADLKTALLNQNVEIKEVVFDNQSSYFSESNFANESNTGHSNQNQQTSNYKQTTSDESETVIAPTDRYYESSRLHQYA